MSPDLGLTERSLGPVAERIAVSPALGPHLARAHCPRRMAPELRCVMNSFSSFDPLHPDLSDLGWTPFFQSQLPDLSPDVVPARVAVEHRGRYELLTLQGPIDAVLTGRLAHEATSR